MRLDIIEASTLKYWLSISLYLAAGLGLYIKLVNRKLIQIREAQYKLPLIALTFLLVTVSATALGYFLGYSTWLLLPLIILVYILVAEIRRLILRRCYRASAPIRYENVHQSLSHPITTTDLLVVHYQIDCPQWKGPELSVAHLSDFHVNQALPYEYYVSAMQRASQAQPDLIFLTGDFVTRGEHAKILPGILAEANSRLGVFAILGNHDYWVGAQQVARMVCQANIPVSYTHLTLPTKRIV